MACGSGCCGPPKDSTPPSEPQQTVSQSTPAAPDDTASTTPTGCEEGTSYCEPSTAPTVQADDDCCKPSAADGKGNCCKSSDSEAAQGNDECCKPSGAEEVKGGEGCCKPSASESNDDCCKPLAVEINDDCCKRSVSEEAKDIDDCCKPLAAKGNDNCSKPSTVEVKDDCCKSSASKGDDNCCKPPAADELKGSGGCCKTSAAEGKDDCCKPSVAKESKCSGGSDADKGATGQNQPSCQDSCCPSEPQKFAGEFVRDFVDDRPSCCNGKDTPCCDESCLDTIALDQCRASAGSSSNLNCKSGKDGKPCSDHSKSARSRYQSKLEALGCICRALVAMGQESCCRKGPRAATSRRSTGRRSGSSSVKSQRSYTNIVKTTSVIPSTEKACNDGCCAPASTCGGKPSADSCCDEKPEATVKTWDKSAPDPSYMDSEKANASKEHVMLAVTGMTCTGCETKLQRTLGTLEPVKNLKTSLILSRTEFDLSPGTLTAEDVMKHLERTTEFKCERINPETSSIDVIVDGDAAAIVDGPWPSGVTDIKRLKKSNTVRIEFDSQAVGGRDLMEWGWSQPVKLAPPRSDPGLDAGKSHVRQMGLMTLLSIVLTIPVLIMAWAPLSEAETAYSSASLALATIVQVCVAGPFYPKALKSLIFSKIVEMDLLIVLSTSAAYIFSVVAYGHLMAGRPLATEEFFETSTLLVTLIMVGRYAAAFARQKATESISVRSLQATNAILVEGGVEKQIDTRLLQQGDIFKVVPDSKVPTDGTVVSGESELDESMLTGESILVVKGRGSTVIAGSINSSGVLTVRLSRLPEHNSISTIASMVDEAKLSKPKIQELADRVATYFVPVVIALTMITFSIWVAIGLEVRHQSAQVAIIEAIIYAITVLIVSCPCAIGLAVPMVIVISTGIAASRGVIFKSSHGIETAHRTSHVVLDKTGTLTVGELNVAQHAYFSDEAEKAKSLLLGLVNQNKHPVSVAVARHLQSEGVESTEVSNTKSLPGKGIEGDYLDFKLRAGQSEWLSVGDHTAVRDMLSARYTVFCFTINGTLAAAFGLEDTVRPEAKGFVTALHSRGIGVHVLSGDTDGAVAHVTCALSIPSENVRSRCSPADKRAYLDQLVNHDSTLPNATSSGKKTSKPVVMFCGDGTNDAVAIAGATIGVHMHGGTDVAQSAADIVLVRSDLTKIITIIDLSRKSVHRIAFNFGWSFVYNLFAILLAAGAFVNARIPPEYAGLGELVSVVPVIIAAALLKFVKI